MVLSSISRRFGSRSSIAERCANQLRIVPMCAIALCVVTTPVALSSDTSGRIGDRYCGPRCAQFLLQWYGIDVPPLHDIGAQMQLDIVAPGTSLDDLRLFIDRHRIAAKAVRIPTGTMPRWPHPAILHIHSDDGDLLGHFVVLLPSSTAETSQIWVGVNGVQVGPARALRNRMSDVVLLTSDSPLPENIDAERYAPLRVDSVFVSPIARVIVCVGGVMSILLAFPAVRRRVTRQRDSPS